MLGFFSDVNTETVIVKYKISDHFNNPSPSGDLKEFRFDIVFQVVFTLFVQWNSTGSAITTSHSVNTGESNYFFFYFHPSDELQSYFKTQPTFITIGLGSGYSIICPGTSKPGQNQLYALGQFTNDLVLSPQYSLTSGKMHNIIGWFRASL